MRKRSKYRPRGVILDTVNWVIGGFRPLATVGNENTKLRLRNHTALESVIKGTATGTDVQTLISASNMTTALVSTGFGDEYKAIARSGADAVESLRNRGNDKGRFICTGPELQSIREMMELHDAQLDIVRINDLDKALSIAKAKSCTVGV